jgi:hypothetical protein
VSSELSYENPVLKLSNIRNAYDTGQLTLDQAIKLYPEWRDNDVYVVLAYIHPEDRETICHVNYITGRTFHPASYRCFKVSKRGNDVYRAKLRKRFSDLSSLLTISNDIELLQGKIDSSNLLFITLTYDTKICSQNTAFNNIGTELNLFLSSMKQKYGHLSVLRCFETFENGYPHLHLIIYFHEHRFPVFQQYNKKGAKVYRVSNQSLHTIESYWHSFVKVEGVRSAGAVAYLLKYILKEQYYDKTNTIGHLWFYHKQSYSISRDFTESLEALFQRTALRLDSNMSNSNDGQHSYVFVMVFTAKSKHDVWVLDIIDPPKLDYELHGSMKPLYDYLTSIF